MTNPEPSPILQSQPQLNRNSTAITLVTRSEPPALEAVNFYATHEAYFCFNYIDP